MAAYDDYLAAFKAADPNLTDAQAKAMAKNLAAVKDAIAALKATNDQKRADKKAEHDRRWALRNTPGQPSKGTPFFNTTTERWERK
jgi:hypothetical protein